MYCCKNYGQVTGTIPVPNLTATNRIWLWTVLKRYTENVADATDQQIELAAQYSIQSRAVFWTFRLMCFALYYAGIFILRLLPAQFVNADRHGYYA